MSIGSESMKLISRILEVYSEEEVSSKIDRNQISNMKNDKKFTSLDAIAKNLDLKRINYSVDDFLDDYPQYKKHKEIKTIYNIQMNGETVGGLSDKNSCSSLFGHIKDGFDFTSTAYVDKKEVLKYFEFDIDLSDFRVRTFKKHTKLYGAKEELEKFKEKYKITYPIAFDNEMEKWHLAFDGMLNDWIRQIYVK